jgi:hypothetical protein
MSKRVALISSLAGLALVDCLWAALSSRASPLVAAAAFLVVAALVLVREEYLASLVIGIAGVLVHAFELVFHGLRGLAPWEAMLFTANLALSIVVALLGAALLRQRVSLRSGNDTRAT